MVIAETELDVKNILDNPTAARLRDLAAAMSIARETEYNNLNVQTVAVARSSKSTFIVADDCGQHSTQCISRAEYERVTALQNEYIAGRDMVVIDGYIGADPEFRTSARLLIEASNANVAAMQQLLYFDAGPHSGEPELSIIYTPNLAVDGYPDERLIVVDLDNYTTRIFNSDYFGESKKAGLRMWNKLVYDRGGLALHAGCKVIPVAGDGGEVRQRVGLIIGLSGTGKTTTTFTQQNNSLPVQDDFVAVMPDGRVYGTENGCFAKTYGLDVDNEPVIYRAVTQPESYLENVAQTPEGKVDFFDDGYTQNGRAVFPMSAVPSHPTTEVGRVDFILILNRNDNIIPAVCRLSGAQAAAYFMLGETKGTSAGGAAEAGKFLRIPGTNPFFPLLHAQQGNRFGELQDAADFEVYVMNTGRVGGGDEDERSSKVKIRHSSAVVKAIAEGTVTWERDPDFGYEIAISVPGIGDEDAHLLQPRRLYEAQGRQEEYAQIVERIRRDRVEYLESWPGLDPRIIAALG